jgi:hypothetical protein
MSCESVSSLGAYVLGAIDERERDRIDEHVAGCARCRDELEALMPLGSYLAHGTPEELLALDGSAVTPQTALQARLRSAARARRRRLVRRRLAAAAALAVAALAVVVWRAGEEPRVPALAASAEATAAADTGTGVRATVVATPRAWGSELRVRVTGATPGERCRLIARARHGRSDVAATWWTTFSRVAEVTGAAAIPTADLIALDVVTASGRRLVHIPMAK